MRVQLNQKYLELPALKTLKTIPIQFSGNFLKRRKGPYPYMDTQASLHKQNCDKNKGDRLMGDTLGMKKRHARFSQNF